MNAAAKIPREIKNLKIINQYLNYITVSQLTLQHFYIHPLLLYSLTLKLFFLLTLCMYGLFCICLHAGIAYAANTADPAVSLRTK